LQVSCFSFAGIDMLDALRKFMSAFKLAGEAQKIDRIVEAFAREFHKAVKLTGLVITKLDGTSKGGAVVAIQRELGIPVKFIGVGEQADDLQAFNAREFAEALFSAKG
jgi:signal recognition particle GTPase